MICPLNSKLNFFKHILAIPIFNLWLYYNLFHLAFWYKFEFYQTKNLHVFFQKNIWIFERHYDTEVVTFRYLLTSNTMKCYPVSTPHFCVQVKLEQNMRCHTNIKLESLSWNYCTKSTSSSWDQIICIVKTLNFDLPLQYNINNISKQNKECKN